MRTHIHGFDLDQIVEAYINCALWASYEEVGDETIDYELYAVSEQFSKTAREEVTDFIELAFEEHKKAGLEWNTLKDYWHDEHIGHDFWLTRAGHGAGFWDRYSTGELEQWGRLLTSIAKTFSAPYLYLGHDELVYCQ